MSTASKVTPFTAAEALDESRQEALLAAQCRSSEPPPVEYATEHDRRAASWRLYAEMLERQSAPAVLTIEEALRESTYDNQGTEYDARIAESWRWYAMVMEAFKQAGMRCPDCAKRRSEPYAHARGFKRKAEQS